MKVDHVVTTCDVRRLPEQSIAATLVIALSVIMFIPFANSATYQSRLHDIWMADTKANAEARARELHYQLRRQVPAGDRVPGEGLHALLAFYEFPAEHAFTFAAATSSSPASPPFGTRPNGTSAD